VKVEYTEETSVRKSLAFEIEAEAVGRELDTQAQSLARKVKLPGFRPGKVPVEVIRKRFHGQIKEDAAEAIVQRVVAEEIDGRGLKPMGHPRVADLHIEVGETMTFRIVFETLPQIELPEYRGLSASVRKASVSDEDVARELARLQERTARFEPVDGRTAATGDFVWLDLKWRVADEARPNRDENAVIEIGDKGNHPELNDALLGCAVGDDKSVRIAYPEDHKTRSLAGKCVDYSFKLQAIKTRHLPALDDEWARDLGEFDSLDTLKTTLRTRLEVEEQARVERETRSALIAALVDSAQFDVPEALIERHMTTRAEGTARGLARQGIDPTKIGIDWERYRDALREESVKAARADILLNEIAKREGIEILPAELEVELAQLAERLKTPKETLRRKMEQEGDLAALYARLREDKTLDLLKANARLTLE
jgi:trigger factor